MLHCVTLAYLIQQYHYRIECFVNSGVVAVLDLLWFQPLSLLATRSSHIDVRRDDWTTNTERVSFEGGQP